MQRNNSVTTPDKAEKLLKPLAQTPARFDATEFLQHNLTRRPGDVLKVTRIPHTDFYRCNWYDRTASAGAQIPGLTVHYIRESKFLTCRLDPAGNPVITYPPRQ